MSKITVTTIAGQTSGADANKVKIESGDTLEVTSNATVGGTLRTMKEKTRKDFLQQQKVHQIFPVINRLKHLIYF